MDLHNNPNLGTDLLAVKVKQLEDKIKQLTQIVGNVEGTIENLSNRVETAENLFQLTQQKVLQNGKTQQEQTQSDQQTMQM